VLSRAIAVRSIRVTQSKSGKEPVAQELCQYALVEFRGASARRQCGLQESRTTCLQFARAEQALPSFSALELTSTGGLLRSGSVCFFRVAFDLAHGVLNGDVGQYKEMVMPRGDKSSYSPKQRRQARKIERSYERRGVSTKEAGRRAWATVNKTTDGAAHEKKSTSRRHAKRKAKSSSTRRPAARKR
jgi:hypothetical protein